MTNEVCPVTPYDFAPADYAEQVAAWLADPHAYFKSFGPEARAFQARNRSDRLRVMTLVAPAEELVGFRPVCISLDGVREEVASWEMAFAVVSARLLAARPQTFAALQAAGELAWLGCPFGGAPVADLLAAGLLKPEFGSLPEVVVRIQWLFLMCGIRLNEVVVQVDPYTDETWAVRREELRRKRAEQQAFMKGRRTIADRECARAKEELGLVRADSRIGYESSNHYFFIPQDLREKILSCRIVK